MYFYFNSRHNFDFVYNDDYNGMYHNLLPQAKDVFSEYYARKVIRERAQKTKEITNMLYLELYRKRCYFKVIELLSGMTYKEYSLKCLDRIKMIQTHKGLTGHNVKYEWFKHIFENPLDYEVLGWDITMSQNKYTEEFNIPMYNVKYNVYRNPKFKQSKGDFNAN